MVSRLIVKAIARAVTLPPRSKVFDPDGDELVAPSPQGIALYSFDRYAIAPNCEAVREEIMRGNLALLGEVDG